jgi:hypothetical protein
MFGGLRSVITGHCPRPGRGAVWEDDDPMRDYERWHDQYDDPDSALSWRLGVVRAAIEADLDRRDGAVRVLSVCSGDGRDLLGVLAGRADADRVTGTLLELHPAIARRARDAAAAFPGVEVRTADAGDSDSYRDAVPADLVLLVGVLGNLGQEDLLGTIAAAPKLCAAGATLVWTRGLSGHARNDEVRAAFADAGFVELDYREFGDPAAGSDPGRTRTAVGVVRFDGDPAPLEPGRRLFTFIR